MRMSRNLQPLSIIYNQKSGFHATQQDDEYERLMTYWTQYGFEIQVFELNQQVNFDEMMQAVFARHQRHSAFHRPQRQQPLHVNLPVDAEQIQPASFHQN